MFKFIPVLFILVSCLFALAIFVTPFSGDFATQQYTLHGTEHTLSSSLCPNPSKVPVLSRSGLESQVDLMRTVSSALASKRICFLAIGDTLKGVVQNQGALPWVDRGDLAFFLQDLPQVVQLRTHFERKGLLLLRERDGYRVCKNNWKRFPFVFLHILEDTRKEENVNNDVRNRFVPVSGPSVGPRTDALSRPNTPEAKHWKNQGVSAGPPFGQKRNGDTAHETSRKVGEEDWGNKASDGRKNLFGFDTDFEEESGSSVCSDTVELDEEEKKMRDHVHRSVETKELLRGETETTGPGSAAYDKGAQFSICTPLNELNEPTWNSAAFNHTMAWDDVFPLRTLPYEDFSLPVPQKPLLILQGTPKTLVRTVPENDIDILFRNSAIKGLQNRLTSKFHTLVL